MVNSNLDLLRSHTLAEYYLFKKQFEVKFEILFMLKLRLRLKIDTKILLINRSLSICLNLL